MTEHYVVTIAKYGTRTTVRSDVYLNHHLYHEADGPIGMDYFFWVVENERRTIVVDTGFSRVGGRNRNREMLMDPPELFDALGVEPARVRDVVLTHAHYDHMGNLDHFPASTIHMARREFEFWTSPISQRLLFHHSVEDPELEYLAAADAAGRVAFYADHHELAPGVELLEIGGHTPGQTVVKVATSEGAVLLASDAVHYYEEYEQNMPFMSVADIVGMYRGFDTIRAMVGSGEIRHVVSGHDPSTLDRFTRAEGPLGELVATIGAAR